MDVIISANDGIKRIIRDIVLDENNKVNLEQLQDMVNSIANDKGRDGVQKI